jgi:hypothetical protein
MNSPATQSNGPDSSMPRHVLAQLRRALFHVGIPMSAGRVCTLVADCTPSQRDALRRSICQCHDCERPSATPELKGAQ